MAYSQKVFTILGVIFLSALCAEEKSDHIKFVVELKLDCPPSAELEACMKNLITLLESDKIHGGQWSVQPDQTEQRRGRFPPSECQ